MTRLAGQSALITGRARGIGRGFAHAYVHGCVRFVVGDVSREAGMNYAPVFLGSPESDYIAPQTYNVDGGQWIS